MQLFEIGLDIDALEREDVVAACAQSDGVSEYRRHAGKAGKRFVRGD